MSLHPSYSDKYNRRCSAHLNQEFNCPSLGYWVVTTLLQFECLDLTSGIKHINLISWEMSMITWFWFSMKSGWREPMPQSAGKAVDSQESNGYLCVGLIGVAAILRRLRWVLCFPERVYEYQVYSVYTPYIHILIFISWMPFFSVLGCGRQQFPSHSTAHDSWWYNYSRQVIVLLVASLCLHADPTHSCEGRPTSSTS